MRLELLADLLLQGDARVVHDAQQANHGQLLVHVGAHLFDGVHQIGQAFESEILTLHRHDDAMGATQAVEREHRQRRRTVDQDEIVVRIDRAECGLEPRLAPLDIHKLHLGPGEFAVGAKHVITVAGALQLFTGNPCLRHTTGLEQHVVNAVLQLPLVDARTHGCVALRVEINHQHALTRLGQAGRQIDCGGGLANPAFLIGDAENPGHGDSASRLIALQRDTASLIPKPIRNKPASFCRARPMIGLARIRSAR